jgi:hypothetical protein
MEVSLYNALPIPSRDTPVQRLIDFKSRREPELLRFRSALDNLREMIVNSDDPLRALIVAEESIGLALADLHRLLDESRIQRIVASMKVLIDMGELNLKKPLPLIGGLAATVVGLPAALGALAGFGISGGVSIADRLVNQPDPVPSGLTNFAYLYHLAKLH